MQAEQAESDWALLSSPDLTTRGFFGDVPY